LKAQTVRGIAISAVFCSVAAAQQQFDSKALLAQAIQRIEEHTRNLPRFTCSERVERQSFSADQHRLVLRGVAVTAVNFSRFKDQYVLEWTDRFRLEFAVFDGRQLFSWPGARSFDHAWPEELIGDGASTAGEFGPFAISVFLADADPASFIFEDGGYRYRVPRERSHFLVRTGRASESVTAFDGRFVVDRTTGDLKRLEVDVVEPPQGSGLLSVQIATEYENRMLGESTALLPSRSMAILVSDRGQVRENQTEYTDCQEFKSESTISFSGTLQTPAAGTSHRESAQQPPPPPPAGTKLWTRMLTRIDTDTTYAGDAVEASVVKPVLYGDGVRIPSHAKLTGRVVRLRRQLHPYKKVTLEIRFDRFDRLLMEGSAIPISVAALGAFESNSGGSVTRASKDDPATIVILGTDRLHWNLNTHRLWQIK
jgi:hypothetical protein